MKKQVYRDTVHEEKTKAELQKALEALQSLLDCWLSLDLGSCEDLFQLVMHPADAYKEGVARTGGLPETFGKYKLKEGVLLDLIDLPIPNELYIKARDCRRVGWTAISALWSIQDGKIIMNEKLAYDYCDKKSIYVTNERQSEFVRHVTQFLESSNFLHDTLTNMPGLHNLFSIPFSIVQRNFPIISKVKIEEVQLNELLKSLQ